MSLIDRLKSPAAVVQFLDSVDGAAIVGYFQEMKDKSIKQLRNSSELKEIWYAQGSADAAEKISDLRKDILKYLDDVRTGKIKPPTPSTGQGAKK